MSPTHACFERGGSLSLNVFDSVKKDGWIFNVAGYAGLPDFSDKKRDDVNILGSLNKIDLINLLNKSDYFVYGLVLPNGISVHHDTYASSILEALACGVIVITWDVSYLRDIYGDNIILIPPPFYEGYDPHDSYGKSNPAMLDPQPFVDAINFLDNHHDEKEELRERARIWALQQTWDIPAKAMHKLLPIYLNQHLLSWRKCIEQNYFSIWPYHLSDM